MKASSFLTAAVAGAALLGSFAGGAVSLTACSDVPKATDRITVSGPSLADFAATAGGVSAVFERSCASIDCHGNESRALRLYSQYGLRLPPGVSTVVEEETPGAADAGSIPFDEEEDAGPAPIPGSVPTTPEEVLANYQSIVSLEPRIMQAVIKGGDPYQLLLLKKPLQVETHKGGPALSKGRDAERCIVSWLKGTVEKAACTASSRLP